MSHLIKKCVLNKKHEKSIFADTKGKTLKVIYFYFICFVNIMKGTKTGMNWVEEWAKLKVIGMWIGIGLVSLVVLGFIVWLAVSGIKYLYKSHSKKYVWDFRKNEYVKKEDFDI